MSWVYDWTWGIWNELLKWAVDLVDTSELPPREGLTTEAGGQTSTWEVHASSYGAQKTEPLWKMVGAVSMIGELGRAQYEGTIAQERHEAVRGKACYPSDPKDTALFAVSRPDLQEYFDRIRYETGHMDDIVPAFHEAYKRQPELNMIIELYNRGLVDWDYCYWALTEQGYTNSCYVFLPEEHPDGPAWVPDQEQEHPYNVNHYAAVTRLLNRVPNVQDAVRMEVRDAFPMAPARYPQETQNTPEFQYWLENYGTVPEVEEWERDTGQSVTEALKEDTTYGPQSFASWFIGGREQYTPAFEKVARARGYDPYWAMKFWESHWMIPSWRMSRRLLWRSPKVTPHMFKQILRWNDYPPGLLDSMVKASYRPLTRVDVRRMHLRGVISVGRVFRSYLDFGYNPENAARMTAFTVVWNNERSYRDTLGDITDSYTSGALTAGQAAEHMWNLLAAEIPTEIPQDVADELSEAEKAALLDTYPEIKAQTRAYIEKTLRNASWQREISKQKRQIDTAEKLYTGWTWTRTRTYQYLTNRGFAHDRVEALLAEWEPERLAHERLPSVSMLEEFLTEQGMSVTAWRAYMRRKGYSDTIIEQILQGTNRLPTRSMLEDWYEDGQITETELRDYLARLGYSQWTIDQIVSSLTVEA